MPQSHCEETTSRGMNGPVVLFEVASSWIPCIFLAIFSLLVYAHAFSRFDVGMYVIVISPLRGLYPIYSHEQLCAQVRVTVDRILPDNGVI